MLKNSARNCIEKRSESWNALNAERSNWLYPGPVVEAGASPKAPAPDRGKQPATELGSGTIALVSGSTTNLQGWVNAAGFPNQYGFPLDPSAVLIFMPNFWSCPGTLITSQPVPEVVPVGQPKVIG